MVVSLEQWLEALRAFNSAAAKAAAAVPTRFRGDETPEECRHICRQRKQERERRVSALREEFLRDFGYPEDILPVGEEQETAKEALFQSFNVS